MKPILEIENVSKKFQIQHIPGGYLSLRERLMQLNFNRVDTEEFWALKDVCFNVQPGESIGIIGRNGAGKSTLLKILSRITPPTKGRIVTRGRVASLLEVGTGFHPELTGRENIFFNGSLLGMKRNEIQKKFDEIVDFSGTEKFLDTPLKHYSSGMQLRLAFAVAAFLEPEILIIDEVLAVGDADFQKKCIGKMEAVGKSGRTIIFVSHNMGAVKNLCKSCILLSNGKVELHDDTDKVIHQYLQQSSKLMSEAGVRYQQPPNARCWIESLAINGSDAGHTSIYYGDKITISAICKTTTRTRAFMGLIVSSVDGIRVVNANNRYQRDEIVLEAGKRNLITCELGPLPLMVGEYSISLYLGDESRDNHVIEDGLLLDVMERDIWGNGKMPPRHSSLVWWNSKFLYETQE